MNIRQIAASFGPVVDARGAEEYAAEVLVAMGYSDARATPSGPDGGLDVVSARAAAQVKFHASPVGRPDVQRLAGAGRDRDLFFFSLSGFTPQASEWADLNGIAALHFQTSGDIAGANAVGQLRLESGSDVPPMSDEERALAKRLDQLEHEFSRVQAEVERISSLFKPKRSERKRVADLKPHLDRYARTWDDVSRLASRRKPSLLKGMRQSARTQELARLVRILEKEVRAMQKRLNVPR